MTGMMRLPNQVWEVRAAAEDVPKVQTALRVPLESHREDEDQPENGQTRMANVSRRNGKTVSGVMPGTTPARAVTQIYAAPRQTWRPRLWATKNSPPKALTDMVF